MKKLAVITLSLFLTIGTAFADSPKDTPKDAGAQPAKTAPAAKPATTKSNAEIAAEMEELRQALEAQQEQLQLLKEELAKRDKQIEEAREAAASANSRATEASVKATEAATTSAEVKSTTSALNTTVASMAASHDPVVNAAVSAAGGQGGAEEKGPTTIRFKGVSITPGGFIAAETVNRQRAESADINSNFNGIPYAANSTGRLNEVNLTGRQSRLSLLFEGKVGDTKLSGYYEADFLGTGVTSNNRESNSYVFRQRQVWARADLASGWSFAGGQMWSLAAENRKGMANRTEYLPAVIDPQYVVGWVWERQYGFRVSKNFSDKVALGFSVEGPQATVGGRGFSTYTSFNAGTGATTTFQNSFVFAPGAGAGLFNFVDTTGYSVNKTPDFIVKAAFDPGFGHYEVFGIVSTFQNRVYPCAVVGTTAGNFPHPATPTVLACSDGTTAPSATGAYNDSRTGGGVGGSLNLPLFHKKLDAGVKVVYGDGIGRYGSAQLQDATLRPDGTMSLIHGGIWLGRVEWHPTPKLDVYGYVGGEYAARAAYLGYRSVKVTITPAIPGCGTATQQPCPGGGIQPSYPALTSTSITTNGFGGYGSPFANNSGCSTEAPPAGTGAPSGGGTCAGDTRYIGEGTLGFWHKIYQGEHGRLQWGLQYSYFYKNAWSGTNASGLTGKTSIQPHAVDNMFWTSFRYYLP
jgi:hypothetical protein